MRQLMTLRQSRYTRPMSRARAVSYTHLDVYKRQLAWNGIAAGEGTLVCCCMDARRQQVYNALFEIKDGKPARLVPDRAISVEELAAELEKCEKRVFLVGDGARLCYNLSLIHI